MMNLREAIEQSINEARQIEYRVAVSSVSDDEGIPATITMLVDKEYQKEFEKWLRDMQDNEFSHAEGGNIEY
jgi:hypothetical protein